jgi:hypothetical protein
MPAPLSWPPPNSVLFAASLCLMALIGEVIATAYPGLGNPTKIAFYSFLPVALWMMTIEQRQDARTIGELEARIVRLEEALRLTGEAQRRASPETIEQR